VIRFLSLSFVASLSTATLAADVSLPPKSPNAQAAPPPPAAGEYGDAKFNPSEAKPISSGAESGEVTVKTTVAEVCPKKGCWMKVRGAAPDQEVRVTFKDYGFFVPTELVGKEVALRGRYVKHVESVEEQRHLLKDAKRPQSEIDAVTKPKESVRFVATGVKDLSSNPK